MSEILTKASLCTGTGALDLATPGELNWYSEIAPGPADLLKREHPDAINIGDFTIGEPSPPMIPGIDLLTSGDPCQSMSAAGRQRASDDSRFLWPDVMRVVRYVRPRHIFLENVQNLRSVALVKGGERGSVLKLRLDNLREAGYAVKWTVLGACAVGAPHHRHRWFLRALYVGANAPPAIEVKNRCGAPRNGGRLLLPTPRATDGVNGGPNQRGSKGDLSMGLAVQEQHWGKFAEAIALWESITGRPAPDPTVPAPRGGRRLNPALSEWMMGYPAGFLTSRLDRNEALRAAGNGVVSLQARAAWEMLEITS